MDEVVVGGFGQRLKREIVRVVDAGGAGDFDTEAERVGIVFFGPDVEDRGTSGLGHNQHFVTGLGGGLSGVGHGVMVSIGR